MDISKLMYSYQWPYRVLRHVAYWCFWLGFYGVVNSEYHASAFNKWLLFELLTMVVKVPYTYFLAYYLFPELIPLKKYVLLVFSVLFLAVAGMFCLMFLYQVFPYEMPGGATEFMSFKTVYMVTDLIYIASPVVLIKMTQQYIKQERNAAKLKQEKTEAELKVLKNQLQPHFLFNNLNNIYSMVITGDQQAGNTLLKLSDLLSFMLYECNRDKVGLDKEIQLIQNYIELEKLRYADRLEISLDVKGETSGKWIAPLLLIPFVENAFKHGAAKNDGKSWIRIHLDVEENTVQYLVENSVVANIEKDTFVSGGIGLENVKKRLKILYPDKHVLIIKHHETHLVKLILDL